MTRAEQKENRRKEILFKALDLFVTRGYRETKITDIAESVGMSVGLLFHYFESKEALYLELIKMGSQGTRFPEGLRSLPPEMFFTVFLQSIFDYAKKEPWVFQMFVLMGQAVKSGPEEAQKIALSGTAVEYSAKIIEEGQKSGVFREGDPIRLAECFWACVQGVMEQMASIPGFEAPDPKWLTGVLMNDQPTGKC